MNPLVFVSMKSPLRAVDHFNERQPCLHEMSGSTNVSDGTSPQSRTTTGGQVMMLPPVSRRGFLQSIGGGSPCGFPGRSPATRALKCRQRPTPRWAWVCRNGSIRSANACRGQKPDEEDDHETCRDRR